MTLKKLALIAMLVIGSVSAAAAAPGAWNHSDQIDRTVDVGEGGGGGGN